MRAYSWGSGTAEGTTTQIAGLFAEKTAIQEPDELLLDWMKDLELTKPLLEAGLWFVCEVGTHLEATGTDCRQDVIKVSE